MATLDFAVDFSGWDRWSHAAAARTQNLTPVHETIGDLLLTEIEKNFQASGGAKAWAPLHKDTLTPSRLRYGSKPLVRSGWLQDNIRKEATSDYVDVGSDWKKAKDLFFGATTRFRGESRPIPERNPFDWRAGVLERVGDMYLKYIVLGGL